MLSLLLLRGWRRRRRILSECQSQDSQHLKSSSSSQYHYHHGQTDKTVARSLDRSLTSSLDRHNNNLTLILDILWFSIASFITAILVVRVTSNILAGNGGGRARPRSRGDFEDYVQTLSRSHGQPPGPRSAAARPRLFASALVRRSNLHGFLRARPVEG